MLTHKFILFRFYSNVKLHICMYLHLIVMKVQFYGLFLHITISVNLKKYNTTKWIQSRVIPGYYFKIKKNQLLKLNVKTYQFIFFVKLNYYGCLVKCFETITCLLHLFEYRTFPFHLNPVKVDLLKIEYNPEGFNTRGRGGDLKYLLAAC